LLGGGGVGLYFFVLKPTPTPAPKIDVPTDINTKISTKSLGYIVPDDIPARTISNERLFAFIKSNNPNAVNLSYTDIKISDVNDAGEGISFSTATVSGIGKYTGSLEINWIKSTNLSDKFNDSQCNIGSFDRNEGGIGPTQSDILDQFKSSNPGSIANNFLYNSNVKVIGPSDTGNDYNFFSTIQGNGGTDARYYGSIIVNYTIRKNLAQIIQTTDLGELPNDDDNTLIDAINAFNSTTFTADDLIFEKDEISAEVEIKRDSQFFDRICGSVTVSFTLPVPSPQLSTIITNTNLGILGELTENNIFKAINIINNITTVPLTSAEVNIDFSGVDPATGGNIIVTANTGGGYEGSVTLTCSGALTGHSE
jgi:hypothetical protein